MIGRLHHVIFDCADPAAAAAFWSAVLGKPITHHSDDFFVVSDDDRTSGLAFALVAGQRASTWPDPRVAQQLHADVMVDDVAEASERVLALGATQLADTVFADPAGHPFLPRPSTGLGTAGRAHVSHAVLPRPGPAPRVIPTPAAPSGANGHGGDMADKKGKGSTTAKKANAKAAKDGKKNPRTSSAAQAELGKKGGRTQKKS